MRPGHALLLVVALAATVLPAAGQEPARAEGFVQADDGVRLYWQTLGERGDTVVFLHGGPGGQSAGRLPDLAELARTHVVLAYDQRGGGRSVADSLTLTATAHVGDLDAVRRHFGLERVTLLGHSWGAALAVLYAARHPDHVERLILNGPMPPARVPFDAEREAAIEQAKWRLCEEMLGAAARDDDVTACTRRPGMNARVYFADTTHIARVTGRAGIDPVAFRVTMRSLGDDWDFRPAMRDVRAPVLVIEGTRSPVPVEQVRVWAQTIPRARLLLIDGAGHGYAMIEAPGRFFPAVDRFLQGIWPDGAVAVLQPDEPRVRPERTLVPAALGSAAGATLGFIAGVGTGIGGGDDPGLLGGLLFGLTGSVLGTAVGVELGSGGRADFASALGASVAGIFGGAALAWAAGAAFDDDAYVFVGYAVGQGTVASLLSAVLSGSGP